jgi:membrane-bound lytic murein transglycosylase A
LPANAALPSGFSAGRKGGDGKIEIYPDRRAIDLGALDGKSHPIAWVRDGIEAFMIHVQGSAAIKLASGDIVRLTYAGRNGHPYTSIGNILIDCGEVPLPEMSLAKLKKWVRDNGQEAGEKGRQLLQCNASYIFFTLDKSTGRATGPIGGAGVPLTPLRSIAVDRTVWPYGLPFWIDVRIPWPIEGGSERHIRQLMIAQDTGSAILGSARADIFVGAGDEAGEIAGRIRHNGRMIVFLPRAI